LRQGLKSIKTQDIVQAIQKNETVDLILFNHFSSFMENPALKPLIQSIFKLHWDIVEYFLTNPENLRNELISTHPELKQILYSPQGIKWLNETCKRGYERIYRYTWME